MKGQPLPSLSKTLPDRRVVVNVGGSRHETFQSTLARVPDARLALLARLGEADESYDVTSGEYFFDRNPRAFGVVMHYLRTGELHIDHSLCGNVLKMEFEYWGIEEQEIEACCWAEYSKFTEHRDALRDLDENFNTAIDDDWEHEKSKFRNFADAAWRFLEEPTSSRLAKIYAVVSMFFVALSITIFVLETHKLFQVDEKTGVAVSLLLPDDDLTPTGSRSHCCCEGPNTTMLPSFSPTTHPVLKILDYICAGFFVLEVIVRFTFAPNKKRFWKDPLNVIDVVCLIPHFTSITLVALNYVNSVAFPIKPFMVLRVIRILRIFKLMKHYSAFKILVYTIKVSTKELLLMIVFLMSGVLMFASIIHYVEKDNFPNIPIAIWWAIVTMTTVGYGDKYPVDYGGYIVGCMCVISGVLVIAFTVPIVVNNFSLYYSHAQTRIKLPQRRKSSSRLRLACRAAPSTARTSISTISTPDTLDRQLSNDLNVPVDDPPPVKRHNPRHTPHGLEDRHGGISPVEDFVPDPTLTKELQEQSKRLIEGLHMADKKLDKEKKRQEFKLKMKRDQRLKEQTNKEQKEQNIDGKMSDDNQFVNKF